MLATAGRSLGLRRAQSGRELLVGAALMAGAVVGAALLARLLAPPEDELEPYSDYEEQVPPGAKAREAMVSTFWPPLFLALAASGLRIWSAPRSPARTQALTLWGVLQALNGFWMALGPRRLGGPLPSTVASLGAAGAYFWRARRVDRGFRKSPAVTFH